MENVNIFEIKGITKEDDDAIILMSKKEIGMTIDKNGRIYNEGGQYIADGKIVGPGFGIGCNTHGGRREGAGRKSTGRSRHSIYVTEYEYESIKEFIEKLRKENKPTD